MRDNEQIPTVSEDVPDISADVSVASILGREKVT